MQQSTSSDLLRLPQVLKIVPVSRSTWYLGVKKGVYPAPVRISRRSSAWRRNDVVALAARFSNSWDERASLNNAGEQA